MGVWGWRTGSDTKLVIAVLDLQANVQRLKAYRSNVVIFPRNVKKPKVGQPQ